MDKPCPFFVVSRFNRRGSIHFVLMLNSFWAILASKNGSAMGMSLDFAPLEKISFESIPFLSSALCRAVAPWVAPEFKVPPHRCRIFIWKVSLPGGLLVLDISLSNKDFEIGHKEIDV